MRKLFLLTLVFPSLLGAQGLRISGVTTMQLIELRPLLIDSLSQSLVAGTGESRTVNGVPAICPTGGAFCQFERSGNRVSAAPILQDVTIAGWGWVEGLSFHGDLRARTQIGNSESFVYPLTDDHLEVVDAYAQLDRENWQGKVGRQWTIGSLGAYSYDGASAQYRHDAFTFEGFSGRALVAGLNEPYTTAQLAAVDNIPPQQNGYLFGARARYRPDVLSAATFTYQRILIADRSGLYSERASLDASTRRFSAVAIDAGLNYDIATNNWNEARLRFGSTGTGSFGESVEYRHSRPYFELWTIWGAFAPVGYDEARATVDYHPAGSEFSYSARGAYRTYAATNTGISLRTNGWRAGGDARWRGQGSLSAFGSYDVDIGSGAADTDVRTGLRWAAASGLSLGADVMVTQNIYEFRVGTGRIYGASFDCATQLRPDVRLVADAGLYQHTLTNGAAGPDWTQRRASMRVEWMLGRDPGAGARVP
ncbi:MAG: hypothetical protein ABI442_15030 [Gemmatimonadaceae bacterium]